VAYNPAVKLTNDSRRDRLAWLVIAALLACNRSEPTSTGGPAGEGIPSGSPLRSRTLIREIAKAMQPEPEAPAPATPTPPAVPAPSALAASLVGAGELPALKVLLDDRLVLVTLDSAGRPGKPLALVRARLDVGTFARRVKPLLPHAPPADGEALGCDDQQRTCVLKTPAATTTFSFTAAPGPAKLREIRTQATPAGEGGRR
jgi:hypothetical protein